MINFIKGKIAKKEVDDGMTVGAIGQFLEDREKVKPFSGENYDPPTWFDLLWVLFKEKSFCSLRKESKGNWRLHKEETSKKIVDYFFYKAGSQPILKNTG